MGRGICDRCGKQLRCASDEAMAAHQRESQHCVPKTKGATGKVAQLEGQLRDIIEHGRRLAAGKGGSFDEVQANLKARDEAEAALKAARQSSKDEKALVKNLAQKSMSAADWTQALLEGDARFSQAEEGVVEQRLAAETVGLVSSAAFRQKREELESEALSKRKREEDAERATRLDADKRKKEKKLKREREQTRGLSFVADDDG
jgi:hypothetical protein